jgi:hypothetical protein
MLILNRTQYHMLEQLLPGYHSAPSLSWQALEPLIAAGLVKRIGFTPVITEAGLVALCNAPGAPLNDKEQLSFVKRDGVESLTG